VEIPSDEVIEARDRSNRMANLEELYRNAIEADIAWSDLLREHFGKNAGDVRYRKAGMGEPNTPLRKAYEVFRDAIQAWQKAEVAHR
jgi:hypothetical protein